MDVEMVTCGVKKKDHQAMLGIKTPLGGVPVVVQWLTNPTGNHEVAGSIPGLAQWATDPAWLWLWWRLAATAPIRPLAWESPHATGVALKRQKDQK